MKELTVNQQKIHDDYKIFLKESWKNTKALNELDKKDIVGFISSQFSIPINNLTFSEISTLSLNTGYYGAGMSTSMPSFYVPPELEDHRELFNEYIDCVGQSQESLGATTSEKNILTRLFSSGKLLGVQCNVIEESNIEENPQYISPDNGGTPINLQAKDKIIRIIQRLQVYVVVPLKYNNILDDKKRLHSLEKPAHGSFLTGDTYHIHGVSFDKNTWEKVKDRKMSVADVIQLKNVEQRRITLELYGADMLVKDATLLDESKRGNKLYQLDVSRGFTKINLHIMQYKDPSTDRIYNSFVPPHIIKADEGMAWKFDITEEEYSTLTIER